MGIWIILSLIALGVLYLIITFNGLVAKRNRVKNAWAQIDVQLKRRHDLIPNLVNAVKGYFQHERDVLENVTRARQQAITAGENITARAAAENMLTQAMRSLFAVAEAYPELKSSQNMMAFQEELSSTENRISFARQFYNDAVMEYNTACEVFPGNVIATNFGFVHELLFALEETTERAVPQVQF
jgi:LemA protein